MSKLRCLLVNAICAAMLFTLSSCGASDPDADRVSDPVFTMDGVIWDGERADLSLDLYALHRDGVVVIQNNGEGNAEDARIRFGVTLGWETGDGLPDQAEYLPNKKQIEYSFGDLVPGDTLECDISGLLHQRWDEDDENLKLVYTLDGTNTYNVSDVVPAGIDIEE